MLRPYLNKVDKKLINLLINGTDLVMNSANQLERQNTGLSEEELQTSPTILAIWQAIYEMNTRLDLLFTIIGQEQQQNPIQSKYDFAQYDLALYGDFVAGAINVPIPAPNPYSTYKYDMAQYDYLRLQ